MKQLVGHPELTVPGRKCGPVFPFSPLLHALLYRPTHTCFKHLGVSCRTLLQMKSPMELSF